MTNMPLPQAPAQTTFADTFREAVRQRGLTLERIRDRLRAQGIDISLATLSYWQRGRSQPERPRSLRAVDALETILALPQGALRSLLGPSRPRGGLTSGTQDLAASQRVYGENSFVEQILGEEFSRFNEDISTLMSHETLHLDENRCLRELEAYHVLRATRDGADRLTLLFTTSESPDKRLAGPVDVSVRCGELGSVRSVPSRCGVVVDILLGRELARNETAVVDFTVRYPPGGEALRYHERHFRVNQREYLLDVYFDPAALPTTCHRYYREHMAAENRYSRRIALDVSHAVHIRPPKVVAGIHGISWEWPE
ncbi:XRE family transcriptional regulator [Streptomyces sp. NPDC003077]|uniref:XRE family transcriptional regulator n=1 Tax=Streptomyces sp. NPDC003077 TaxID=3154443 RepID=UPI0033B94927